MSRLTHDNRLASIDGEWHEFESKALRKENERKAREARRAEAAAAAGGAPGNSSTKDRDRKRAHESRENSSQRGAKRAHLEGQEPIAAATAAATENAQERVKAV